MDVRKKTSPLFAHDHMNGTGMNKAIKTFIVAGARPNFMKIAPIWRAITKYHNLFCPILIHTGQHYDYNMSDSFFTDLDLPNPHYFLGVGSGTHSVQTAKIMVEFEKALLTEQPEVLIVVGDVNSTLACALVACKTRYCDENNNFCTSFVKENHRPLIVHVEAGLRSYDRTMPEEINRILTDAISDILFTPSSDADENLKIEGINPKKIICVGNIMIDALEFMRQKINNLVLEKYIANNKDFGLITLHRPSNVDDRKTLETIIKRLLEISKKINLVFPVHPRTKKQLELYGSYKLLSSTSNIIILEPLSYLEFMKLLFDCKFVLTDSGGLQEETTYLGIPCLTLRSNTERPVTVLQGTNELVTVNDLEHKVERILIGNWKKGSIPKYWDGKTAERIISALIEGVQKMHKITSLNSEDV